VRLFLEMTWTRWTLIHSFKCDYFEWAKTGDLRAEYMDTSETLGNDMDKLDIDPQFQL